MLASRSTRLAASLLLALLLGWTTRAYRKELQTPVLAPVRSPTAPLIETPNNAFPDE